MNWPSRERHRTCRVSTGANDPPYNFLNYFSVEIRVKKPAPPRFINITINTPVPYHLPPPSLPLWSLSQVHINYYNTARYFDAIAMNMNRNIKPFSLQIIMIAIIFNTQRLLRNFVLVLSTTMRLHFQIPCIFDHQLKVAHISWMIPFICCYASTSL